MKKTQKVGCIKKLLNLKVVPGQLCLPKPIRQKIHLSFIVLGIYNFATTTGNCYISSIVWGRVFQENENDAQNTFAIVWHHIIFVLVSVLDDMLGSLQG